jgi:hypothetical protein
VAIDVVQQELAGELAGLSTLSSSAELDGTDPPAVRGHHAAMDQVAAAVVAVVVVIHWVISR